jgi:uncharacterized lipoprotein YddW (UPF0748 family)
MHVNRQTLVTIGLILIAVIMLLLAAFAGAQTMGDSLYLPYIAKPEDTPTPTPTPTATPQPQPGNVEFRGLWVTRFNWTSLFRTEQPEEIDAIVDDAAYAGFNALLFQVRGEADAYYRPGPEPWSARLVGLGQDPGWDPLQRMIDRAHGYGMQVHAYINIYPVWGCGSPPPHTSPEHLYHRLIDVHGISGDRPHGLQWTTSDQIPCSDYVRATPASFFVDDHLMEVATYLVQQYDIDGLHLDHIRYGGAGYSCDPVSEQRAGGNCFQVVPQGHASYADWQRAQVNGTVNRFYNTLFGENGVADRPNMMLSAAVWPIYTSGYNNYYQDSKAWIGGGYIDALMPMIYGSFDSSPTVWRGYAADFQAANAGRFIIPGIHGGVFGNEPGTFEDIAQRIQAARDLGTAGHAIFAYNYLKDGGYFDDLRNGPYSSPAAPPTITWHP